MPVSEEAHKAQDERNRRAEELNDPNLRDVRGPMGLDDD